MKKVVKTKEITKLISDFCHYCKSDTVSKLARKDIRYFTRKRVFTVFDLICFLMFRSHKTTNQELSSFFSKANRLKECVSKQAIHQALSKMNPVVFMNLFKKFRELFYSSKLVKTFKNYIILSEDGTFLEIPFSFPNIMNYGFWENQHVSNIHDVKKVMAKGAGIYDVINGIFLDFIIRPANYSEMPLAIQHLCRIKDTLKNKSVIFLADRYYGSVELIYLLKMFGFNYCIRAKSNFYKDQVSKIEKDGWITLNMTPQWLKRFKYDSKIKEYAENNPVLNIRVVKKKHSYTDKNNHVQECELIYFTDLSPEVFNSEEISSLYSMRWDIETSYKTLKITEEIERVNTSKQNVIECKIYAKVLYFNFLGLFRKEIDFELQSKKTEKHKNGFRVNQANLHHLMNDNLLGVIVTEFKFSKLKDVVSGIIIAAQKKIIPVRPDRHYQRWGRFIKSGFFYRFRLDGRNNPKVKNYKGGLITIGS